MGFGAELKGFASGFTRGVQLANQTRDSLTQEYRHGRPRKSDIESQPGLSQGPDVKIGEKAPSVDTGTTGSTPHTDARREKWRQGISSIESGSPAGNYQARGPRQKDEGQALGRYQIMSYNVGPWSKQVLGREVTPQEFLANPQIQDQIFDGIFGSYVEKYGEKGAAEAWFGGPGSVGKGDRKDSLGTTVKSYGSRFADFMGGGAAPVAGGGHPGTTASSAAGIIPDEDEEDDDDGGNYESPPIDEEDGTQIDPADVSWDLAPVDLPEITVPQVETMFAAEGGVIPDPNPTPAPRPTPDPYNAARNYTQPIANDRPTFVPRRITNPVLPDRVPLGTRTASQLALDAARAKAAAGAPAPGAGTPPGGGPDGAPLSEADKWKRYSQFVGQMGVQSGGGGSRVGQNEGHMNRSWTRDPMRDSRKYWTSDAGQQAFMSGVVPEEYQTAYDRAIAKKPSRYQNWNFAEGGVVPSISPEYWEKAVKRERRRPGQMSDQDARDTAAKRLNRRERGLTSTAVNVGGPKGGGKPAPKGGGGGGGGTDGTTTSAAPGPTVGETPRDTGRLSPENTTPEVVPPSNKPGRLSDEYVPPIKEPRTKDDLVAEGPAPVLPDLGRNPYDEQRGYRLPGEGWATEALEGALTPAPEVAQGGVESPIPGVAAPVTPQNDQPRGGTWSPPGPGRPAPAVSPAPPQVTPDDVTNILNDAVPTGPGAPRITTDSIRQLATQAVQEGGEAARAKLQEIWNSVKDKIGTANAGAKVGALAGAIPEQPASPEAAVPAKPTPGALEQQYQVDPDTGQTIDMTTGLPVGEKGFGWRDFLNLFLDESYKGPEGKGVLFAAGGVVPEEDEEPTFQRPVSQRDPGYTTSAPGASSASSARAPAAAPAEEPARKQYADVKPSKRLRDDVAKSLDGGIKFLTRHFGLGQEGAVPSPDDEPRQRQGIERFVRGEGAATPDELKGIDAKIDPDGQLDEDYRQMNRFAQTMQFYQSAGRKDEAEAAAGSLLQYGAQRFGRLGSMAANQYQMYEQTGDQEYLQGTINMLEQAYKMVPDGAKVDVSIDPESGGLQVTKIDADGNEEDIPLKSQDIPALIKSVQDGSSYWKSIYRLADPAGAKEEATAERRRQEADTKFDRDVELKILGGNITEEAADRRYKEQGLRDEKLEKWKVRREEAKDKAALAENRRRYPQMNWDLVTPLLAEAKKAQLALSEDSENEDLIAANNAAGSALFQAVSGGTRDPANVMADLGVPLAAFDLIAAPPGGVAGAPAAPAGAETPPAQYPNAKRGKDKAGNPIWVVIQDGKPYQVAE